MSKTMQDRGIVTLVDYYKIVCHLLNHVVTNDLGSSLKVISAILKLSIAKNYKYVHAHLDVMWTLLVLPFLVHRRHNYSRTITIHK